jgi:hypothetical protein
MLSRIGLVLRVTAASRLHDLRGQIPVKMERKQEGKKEIDLPEQMSSAARSTRARTAKRELAAQSGNHAGTGMAHPVF